MCGVAKMQNTHHKKSSDAEDQRLSPLERGMKDDEYQGEQNCIKQSWLFMLHYIITNSRQGLIYQDLLRPNQIL